MTGRSQPEVQAFQHAAARFCALLEADIYRDIKPGLRAWETNDDKFLPMIIFGWKEPLFSSHWGVHAVDAMWALHPIAYLRGVQPNDVANWSDSS